MTKQELDAAIVADLRSAHLTYSDISSKYRVGMTRIIALAKLHSLTRRRGRKLPIAATQGQE